jgi:hypothetical protein
VYSSIQLIRSRLDTWQVSKDVYGLRPVCMGTVGRWFVDPGRCLDGCQQPDQLIDALHILLWQVMFQFETFDSRDPSRSFWWACDIEVEVVVMR